MSRRRASPFSQIPNLPGGTVSAEPPLWLCAVTLTISTLGLIGLRRRDLGDRTSAGASPRNWR
jgi:ABC-2 type transport system permease protein